MAALTSPGLEHPSYSSILATDAAPPVDMKPTTKHPIRSKYALGKGDQFPTDRRPNPRPLSEASNDIINSWWLESQITIGPKADTIERLRKIKRLLYTYRDCFAESVKDVKATDLIEHSIYLVPNAHPVKGKSPRYSTKERDFANTIFPAMEDAGIITRRSSPWGARTKFPPKKKGSEDLRVVHNVIPVNKYTIKSSYPVHRLDEVLDTIIKPGYDCYFSSDAANGYWAIPMKQGDENKTGFMTPNGQWVYLRMGQGLKGAAHTYARFSDLVFGPLPGTSDGKVKREPTAIGRSKDAAFRSTWMIMLHLHGGLMQCMSFWLPNIFLELHLARYTCPAKKQGYVMIGLKFWATKEMKEA